MDEALRFKINLMESNFIQLKQPLFFQSNLTKQFTAMTYVYKNLRKAGFKNGFYLPWQPIL